MIQKYPSLRSRDLNDLARSFIAMGGDEQNAENVLLMHCDFMKKYNIENIRLSDFPFFYQYGSHKYYGNTDQGDSIIVFTAKNFVRTNFEGDLMQKVVGRFMH